MDISQIPFSMAGSYLAVSEWKDDSAYGAGCYIRSVHGMGYMPGITMMRSVPFCARILPCCSGTILKTRIQARYDEVSMMTEKGSIRITFGDERTLLLQGKGSDLGLELELADGNFIQHFIPTDTDNCRLHSITSERIGNPELKAAMKCVHEYEYQ